MRKIIQLIVVPITWTTTDPDKTPRTHTREDRYALCNDGTVWRLTYEPYMGAVWTRTDWPAVPQGPMTETSTDNVVPDDFEFSGAWKTVRPAHCKACPFADWSQGECAIYREGNIELTDYGGGLPYECPLRRLRVVVEAAR